MAVKERLTLEDAAAPTLLACEHTHRYEMAAELVGGLRVLDLCCGSGYGTRILARAASSVHGVDVDAATIDIAGVRASDVGTASYETADALEFLSRGDVQAQFDAIVCFDGLEHLPAVEPVFERLRDLAADGMRLLVSVPNSKGMGEDNEYHLTDFSFESATRALGSLPGAVILDQYLTEGSVILVRDADLADAIPTVRLDERRDPPYANHYLACVGFDPSQLSTVARFEAAPAYNRYQFNLERANRELRRTNARLFKGSLGKSDSAAAANAAKLEGAEARARSAYDQLKEVEQQLAAWVDRCLGAEAREQELARRAAEANRLSVRLAVKALDVVRPRRRS